MPKFRSRTQFRIFVIPNLQGQFFLRRLLVYWKRINEETERKCSRLYSVRYVIFHIIAIGIANIACVYHLVKQLEAGHKKVKGYQTIVLRYKLRYPRLPHLHIYYRHNRVDRFRFFFRYDRCAISVTRFPVPQFYTSTLVP